MIVEKCLEVISFGQIRWLKTFITLNTDNRAAAKNEFEKDLLKTKV